MMRNFLQKKQLSEFKAFKKKKTFCKPLRYMSAKRKHPSATSKADGELALNREHSEPGSLNRQQFIVFTEQSG